MIHKQTHFVCQKQYACEPKDINSFKAHPKQTQEIVIKEEPLLLNYI